MTDKQKPKDESPLTDEELDLIDAKAAECTEPGPKAIAEKMKIDFEETGYAALMGEGPSFDVISFVMLQPAAARRLVAEVRRLRQRVLQIDVSHLGSAKKAFLCNACGKIYDGGPFDEKLDVTPPPWHAD